MDVMRQDPSKSIPRGMERPGPLACFCAGDGFGFHASEVGNELIN